MTNTKFSHEKFAEDSLAGWSRNIRRLFPIGVPAHARWSSKKEIIAVLNTVGVEHTNHMLFPGGGGHDLEGAIASVEPDCVELNAGGAQILKPARMTFESFEEHFDWAYFRLEAAVLRPSGVYKRLRGLREELTELTPGCYVHRSAIDAGYHGFDEDGGERPLPRGARTVARYFRGSFLVVAKFSAYNLDSSTYDARHSQMTRKEFRAYMDEQFRQSRLGA